MPAQSLLVRLLPLLVLALAATAAAQDQRTVRQTIVSGGLARSYLLHVPAAPRSPAPLMLCFHGFTSSGQAMEDVTGFSAMAEREGFVVVYPDALPHPEMGGTSWFGFDGTMYDGNVAFIGDLIASVRRQVAVDPRRIFATGMSQGGGMCYFAAANYAQVVASIAPVVVSIPTSLDLDALLPDRPMSVLMMNGTADPLVPYLGGVGIAGTVFMPTRELARRFAAHDACFPFPISYGLPDWNWFDGCTAGVDFYGWGAQGSEVVLYTVTGGGHTWPMSRVWLPAFIFGNTCQDFDASRVIWDFFASHPMPAGVAD